MTASAGSSVPTEILSIDHSFFRFSLSFFLLLLVNAIMGLVPFTTIYPKIDMNVVKLIPLGNNLPTHIRENTDFSRQKSRQLPSGEVTFKGC